MKTNKGLIPFLQVRCRAAYNEAKALFPNRDGAFPLLEGFVEKETKGGLKKELQNDSFEK